jgi:hypothetical protein
MGAWQAKPSVMSWWEDREAANATRSDIKQFAPAVAALNALPWPTGTRACADKPVNRIGLLCVRESGSVTGSAGPLAVALESQRVTFSERRCVRLRDMTLCRIAGQLMGQHFEISVGPDTTRGSSTGVFLSGGLGSWSAMPLPRAGVPIDFPA